MTIRRNLFSTAIATVLFLSPNLALAEGCSLDGVKLNCTSQGKSAKQIMAAFASPETREALQDPIGQRARFQNNGDLETYRKSMERNWRTITRHARQQERRRKQRRISEQEFESWKSTYAQAELSYDAALDFYRQLHWIGVK